MSSALKAKDKIVDNKNKSVRTIVEQQSNKIKDHQVLKGENNIDQYGLQKSNKFINKDHNKQIVNQISKQKTQQGRKPKIIRAYHKDQKQFFKSLDCIKFIQKHQKKSLVPSIVTQNNKPKQPIKQLIEKPVTKQRDQIKQSYSKKYMQQLVKKKTYQIAHDKNHQKKSQINKWKSNFPSNQQIKTKNIQSNQQSNQQNVGSPQYHQAFKKQQENKYIGLNNNQLKQSNKKHQNELISQNCNQQVQNLKKRIQQIQKQNQNLTSKLSICEYFAISEIMDIEQQKYIIREIKDYLNLFSTDIKDFKASLLYRWDKYNINFFKYLIHEDNKYNLLMVVETVNNKKLAVIFERICKNNGQASKMVLYSLTTRSNFNQQYQQHSVSFDGQQNYLLFGNQQIRFMNKSNRIKFFLGSIGRKKCFNINNSMYLIEEDIIETQFRKMQIYKIMI